MSGQAVDEDNVRYSNTEICYLIILKDWFFDIIINFLRSPRWKSPIMSFLDDNCIVFDTEDENKLEYTVIHNVNDDLIDYIIVLTIFTIEIQKACRRLAR